MDTLDHIYAEGNEPHVLKDCEDPEHELRQAAIVLENACLVLSNREVIHNANITVRKEAITAIVGPNGSGKTSILKMIAGIIPPSAGSTCRHNVSQIGLAEQIDSQSIWWPMRVKDAVKIGRYSHTGLIGLYTKNDKTAIQEAAKRMNIEDLMSRQISKLSVGQRRRVGMAMCLAKKADVLILDEPEAGLDIAARKKIFAEMSSERNRGAAVAFATHSIEEASRSDHVILLKDGHILTQGSPAGVLCLENLSYVFGSDSLRANQCAA